MISVLGIVGVGVGAWAMGVDRSATLVSIVWGAGLCRARGVSMAVLVDSTSLVFARILAAVALTAYRYSNDYLGEGAPSVLFYNRLWAFTARMLLLIFASDLFLVFLAWDGLGVRSFLLVCHYDKPGRRGGALVTIVTNRAGDAFFCLGVGVIAVSGGRQGGGLTRGWAAIFFVLAAFSKSAQWPLCAWLPAAMAAPTPISALVHRSTLVTAGIYLLVRNEMTVGVLGVMGPAGALTFFVAGVGACLTFDVKRLVAMSTLGHLGFIVACFGVGRRVATMYHLYVHALFKRVLFMCAGNFIQSAGHSQDIRDMGGVAAANPARGVCRVVCFTRLAGMPLRRAFFSKGWGLGVLFMGGGLIEALLVWGAIVASTGYCVRYVFYLYLRGQVARTEVTRVDCRGSYLHPAGLVFLTFVGGWALRIHCQERARPTETFMGWEICFLFMGAR